jgi:hypothetical protein
MSPNSLAETQLAPRGYAALTFDARGARPVAGARLDRRAARDRRRARALSAGSRPGPASNGLRIGAFGFSYGGGAILARERPKVSRLRAIEPAITWTDLYSALLPQDLARSGILLGFWQSIQARAAPGLQSIVDDAIAGPELRALHAFADERSVAAPRLDPDADVPLQGGATSRSTSTRR